MENLEIYERARTVPEEAKKPITSGRLNGKTDINPMWRIKKLTELFGPCGIGWWYVIKSQRTIAGTGQNVCAFVDIDLYYKVGEDVSQPIPGIGGSAFVAEESKGAHTSDECFKMALTDAIGVAAKALGVGADVYWEKGASKYNPPADDTPPKPLPRPDAAAQAVKCADCGAAITDYTSPKGNVTSAADMIVNTQKAFGRALCGPCSVKAGRAAQTPPQETTPPAPPRADPAGDDPLATYCERCGVEILPTTVKGRLLTVPEILRQSKKAWGLDLCISCQDAEQRAMEAYAAREDERE